MLVLYMGTPCQITAIKYYLVSKKVSQCCFYTCDILCHGVGSPGIWKSFITHLEDKKSTKIGFLTFKDKKNGWKKPLCVASDDNRESIHYEGIAGCISQMQLCVHHVIIVSTLLLSAKEI